MDRSLFSGGPAFLTWNGITIQLASNWSAETEIKTVARRTNLRGRVGAWEDYSMTVIKGTPVATSANLASLITKLFPYTPAMVGQLIFPSVDLPAVIQTKDGRSLTYAAAAITKMPSVKFKPNEDPFGEFELTCLCANQTAASEANSHVTEASSTYTEPSFDPLTLISGLYAFAWGATAPFDDIETDENGVELTPAVDLKELSTQLGGLLNYRIADVSAQAKFTPVNLSSEDFYSLMQVQGSAAGRGKAMGSRGLAFTATPAGSGAGRLSLNVPLAVPQERAPLRFGDESRIGEVLLDCAQKSSAGTIQALYTLASSVS
jgi:hypothetical protein